MTLKAILEILFSAKLLAEREALCRENGYRLAHLDLLDVLSELKEPANVLEIEELFRQRLQIRELNKFTVHESDFKGH